MKKMAVRVILMFSAIVGVYLCYEVYAYAMHERAVKSAIGRCAARTAVALAHTELDGVTFERTLRNISEAIDYVDGVASDAHLRSGARKGDEQGIRYLKLCGDTLRSERAFVEAAMELTRLGPEIDAHGHMPRELAYDELVRRHSALRQMLTEMINENQELAANSLTDVLVDIGSIEAAQREVEMYYGRAK